MPFETFKRQRTRPSDDPLVTIQRKGVFSLNYAAFQALGEPEAVELLYDHVERLIGIRKVDPSVDHGYVLRNIGRGRTWILSGTAFTKYYGIDTTTSRRWTGRMFEDMLIVDLKDEGQEVFGNRSRAPRVGTAQQTPSGAEQVSPT